MNGKKKAQAICLIIVLWCYAIIAAGGLIKLNPKLLEYYFFHVALAVGLYTTIRISIIIWKYFKFKRSAYTYG
jgi:hypothetical protein